ncbi:MAG: L-idonate 5-dehydrogenase [Betaproteobacteria bacterium]|nr:L-idonate 5-dehydrogenase [Betaproteobacteria bacterium]
MPQALVIHGAQDLRIEETPAETLGEQQLRVHMRAGGICGSDLHYYQHGGFGTVRVKQPMVLGHEVSGQVVAVGQQVQGVAVGQRVAISPSRPCGQCLYCQKGQHSHCLHMRFYGSAMPWPHIQGAFRQEMIIEAWQAHAVADSVSDGEAAMAEPLSVALHAVRRAGQLAGARVLVTGCGPIGALCVLAARWAGAAQVVATDITDQTLARARLVGADHTINTATTPDGLAGYKAHKGHFDVLIEASGNANALVAAFEVVRPRGVIVQVGTGGDTSIPLNVLVAKEFEWRGSFRFHEEFALAVDLMNQRRVDVKPLISHSLPHTEYARAFALAADRTQAMKVQLTFA